jgi:sugar phosphate isomerase/epimerase
MVLAASAQKIANPFFAFDNGTGRDQKVPLEEQAEMLKRAGYAGMGYTGTQHIPEMLQALESRGLKMFSTYVQGNVDDNQPRLDPGLAEAVKQLKGHGTAIWLYIRGHSPEGEARAVAIVREAADLAAGAGLRVVLYPHWTFYVDRVEEAVRIRKLAGRDNVGVAFNLPHFLAARDEANLDRRLKEAMPFLELASINGADHPPATPFNDRDWDKLIQPLDRGEIDVCGVVKKMVAMGYKGPIGLQCYRVPGDMEENLRRSIAAWRKCVD